MTNRVYKRLTMRKETAQVELLIDSGIDGITMETWCKICKSNHIKSKRLDSGSLGTVFLIFGSKHHLRFFLSKYNYLMSTWWTTY